jgi:hypothetical protein
MLAEKVREDCLTAFLELVFQNTQYSGKTFCYFHPFISRQMNFHITVAEKSTGFGIVIPIHAKNMMILEKSHIKDIMHKTMEGLLIAVEKHKDKAKPVDYKKFPLKSQGKFSVYEKIESNQKVKVEIYGWSKITTKVK